MASILRFGVASPESPTAVETERSEVGRDADIVSARQRGRELALRIGFGRGHATLIATAISELSRNILLYAGRGEILLEHIEHAGRPGVRITARDNGPGIPDVTQALLDGFSTSRRLGLGLPGVRRIMDEFSIRTAPGRGTTVQVTMWLR